VKLTPRPFTSGELEIISAANAEMAEIENELKDLIRYWQQNRPDLSGVRL
jgi:hypothetical protein